MDNFANSEKKMAKLRYEQSRVKISLRFTPEEMKSVVEFAEKAGLPVATYVHDVALNPKFKIVPARPRINVETKAEIQRIGINFNQIARAMNNYSQAKNFDRINVELTEIGKILKAILDKI